MITTGTTEEVVNYIDNVVQHPVKDSTLVPALTSLLKNQTAEIKLRERAAWALGRLEARAAIPTLVQAAKDKGLLIRSAALDSLAHLRARDALNVFIEIAKKDPILALRQQATIGLGLLQWDKTIPTLVDLAVDEREEIRGAVTLAMAMTHSTRNDFTEALKQMNGDASAYVRARAVQGLAFARRNVPAMKEELGSPDMDLRLVAAVFFNNFGKKTDLRFLEDAWNGEAEDDVRYELKRAINSIKKRAAAATAKHAAPKKAVPAKKPAPARAPVTK